MSDRLKGEELARKFCAPKTAEIIAAGACYEQIFATATKEIGASKLVEALVETSKASWAYYALLNIPNLTGAERTKLCDVIIASKNAEWAFFADLSERQRMTLQEIARAV